MVCLVVLVVSGLVVYWIGEATNAPTESEYRPPAAHQPHETKDKSPVVRRQETRSGEGG